MGFKLFFLWLVITVASPAAGIILLGVGISFLCVVGILIAGAYTLGGSNT